MVDCGRELSLARQCQLLDVSRSSQYYAPLGESSENLALMRWLDELHLAYPFYGSRQMVRHLRREGVVTNGTGCGADAPDGDGGKATRKHAHQRGQP